MIDGTARLVTDGKGYDVLYAVSGDSHEPHVESLEIFPAGLDWEHRIAEPTPELRKSAEGAAFAEAKKLGRPCEGCDATLFTMAAWKQLCGACEFDSDATLRRRAREDRDTQRARY